MDRLTAGNRAVSFTCGMRDALGVGTKLPSPIAEVKRLDALKGPEAMTINLGPRELPSAKPSPSPSPFAVIALEDADSTSDYAKRLLLSGVPDAETPALPFAVRARRQTRGRGRGDRSWWSDEGTLCFSIALDPIQHGLAPAHEIRLALIAALAVIDAVRELVPAEVPLGIRWPNDVESDDRKLCGTLPERVETPDGPRILVGIGINVRSRLEQAPPAVRDLAATVEQLRGAPVGDDEFEGVFQKVLTRFEQLLAPLVAEEPQLAERWDGLSTLRGRRVRVLKHDHVLEGIALGIDPTGALNIACPNGIQTIVGGQVLR